MVKRLALEQPRHAIADQRRQQQRQPHGGGVAHLADDDRRGDRRLHHAGEIGGHAQQHDGARGMHMQDVGDHITQPRADRERWREESARNARQGRGQGGDHLQRRKAPGHGRAFHRQPRRLITGAIDFAMTQQAAQCHQQAAAACQHQTAPAGSSARPAPDQAREIQHRRREQRPGQPACNAADEHRDPVDGDDQHRAVAAEIVVIAHQTQRGDTGQDHRDQHQAGIALFEGAAHFLDGKDDARQRRVEGCRHTGRRACQDQSALAHHPPDLAGLQQDGRADLHGRPLAADGGAAGHAEQGEKDLAEGETQRQKPRARRGIFHVTRRDGLGNARALAARKEPRRQPGRQHETHWRQHQRNPGLEQHGAEQMGCLGRGGRKNDTDNPNRQRATPEYQPHPPSPAGKQQLAVAALEDGGHVRASSRAASKAK